MKKKILFGAVIAAVLGLIVGLAVRRDNTILLSDYLNSDDF